MTRHGRRIKRCGTCVERKVKCDEQQPYCQRCKNAGLACSGYHSHLKFVDEGTRFSPASYSPQAASKPTTSTQCSRVSPKCVKASKPQIRSIVPQKGTFYLPYTLSKVSPGTSHCHNISLLSELLTGHQSALHQSCVQALAAVYFGKTNQDRNAFQQGLWHYSHALTQLRTVISDATTDIGTLMSVMCLCVYENLVFSQPTAWLMHYDGLGRLMQSRGPKPWRTPAERQMLQFARYFIILSAGHRRSRCFLDQPQWESTRCMPEDATPDRIDILYDLFARSPGIVEDYDLIRRPDCVDPSALEVLRNRTQVLIDQTHAWLRDIPWVCTTDPVLRDNSSIPLPDDPMDCVALAVCYGMLLCLVQPCEYLGVPLIPGSGHEMEDLASVTRILALDICRFANQALRGEGSTNFALMLIYPLQIAWFCLQNREEDLGVIRGIMNSVVADSHGFEVGRIRQWDETSLDQGRYGFLY